MKLVRFLQKGKESYAVQVNKDEILDVLVLAEICKQSLPPTLDGLILQSAEAIQSLEVLMCTSTESQREKETIEFSAVKVLAPIVWPPKIICLGANYRDHAAELKSQQPDEPVIFMKPHTSIIGHDDTIIKPSYVKELDYEAELAIIVGKKGKNIAVDDARKYIFGYTCFNDVSARDIQFKDRQWTRGKSLDTFAPIGPCITTDDQIGDPEHLQIQTRVNGETRQNSSTSNMIFNVYQIVHHLSRIMTLEPCDVIATGTPAGVAFAMKPKPKFLAPGDIVEIEIENIGVLRNQVREDLATMAGP